VATLPFAATMGLQNLCVTGRAGGSFDLRAIGRRVDAISYPVLRMASNDARLNER